MAALVCLPAQAMQAFRQALIGGRIKPEALQRLSSEERRALFEKIVGKDGAELVNTSFEKKLLLKNVEKGVLNWAKDYSGVSAETKAAISAKLKEEAARKNSRLWNPSDRESFLGELVKDSVHSRYKADVTFEEARKIADLTTKVQTAAGKGLSTSEQAMKKGFTPSASDLAHGYARYDLQKYVSDLKNGTDSFKLSDLKTAKGIVQNTVKLPKRVADISKSIGASLDDSFALRQGLKSLFTNPKQWQKEFRQSFVNIAKGAKNADVAQREFKAHLMADPMYDQAVKDGLAITKQEDVFPTSLPGKIPVAGRAFNASEVAYEAYAENLRLALYKNQLRLATNKGVDMSGTFGKNVATMVNSLTGRGGLGRLEPVSGPLNVAFYSLRFLKSNIDTLLLHPVGSGIGGTADFVRGVEGAKVVSYAQKEAAKNIVKIITGIAATLAVADALKPGSVEKDPRSADFGMIKIGHTRFNVSAGMGSLATLAARVITGSSKSSSTGVVSKINSNEYGAPTKMDVITDFLTNKTSPVGGVAVDYAKGKTHNNTKPTAANETGTLVEPLNVKNYTELKNDPQSANILASVLADTFGISTNTYGKSTKNYNLAPSPTLQAFQKKVGNEKFQQANNEYNKRLDQFMRDHQQQLNSLNNSDKDATITAAKAKIQKLIYSKYGFTPPKTKPSQGSKKILDTIK